mgnify:CR=1 FL=1
MQNDVEVLFCELCGTSVSVGDLAAGSAVRHQGKIVGSCCLPGLRAAVTGAAPAAVPAPRAARDSRILPFAVMVVAAIAGATIFLDQRTGKALADVREAQARLVEAHASDSHVLAGLGVAMDAVPRRVELDGVVAQMRELAGAFELARNDGKDQVAAVARDVAQLAAAQRTLAEKVVDHRPLFEDLRQRQVRMLDLLTTMRAVAPPPATPETVPAPTPPVEGDAPPALPPALAAHVQKLAAADPATRFEAVDELLRSKNAAVLVHLLPMAKDGDAFVRRLTVEGLAEFRRPEVVEALLVAMADSDEWVRDTAWRSLKDVSGQKLAFDSSASKDSRARALQKWQDWWEKSKATFGS